ncbi:MAG: translocation/assembly module TamB domain-containing protein [Bacteroidia bacterium]
MKKARKILGRLFKWGFISLTLLLIIVLGLVASLALPPVQTRLVRYARTFLEKELGTKVEIGFVDIGLPKWAILKNVAIYDKQNIPAIQVKSLKIGLIGFPFRAFIEDLYYKNKHVYHIVIQEIELQEPNIYLYKSVKDSTLNLAKLFSSSKKKDTTKTESPFHFDIQLSDVSIENGKFRFIDSTNLDFADKTAPLLNYANLEVEKLNLMTTFFLSDDGVLDLKIKELQVEEKNSGFKLKHFKANIRDVSKEICDFDGKRVEMPNLKIDSLSLISGKTNLNLKAAFPKHSLAQIISGDESIINSRKSIYIADFQKSSFAFDILDHFVPPIPVRGVVNLEGHAEGSFTGIQQAVLKAKYGKDIELDGNVKILDWDKGDNFWLDVNIRRGKVSGDELCRLLPQTKFPDFFHQIGKSDLKGTFVGKYYDFKTDLSLKTPLGLAAVDMAIFIPMKKPDDLTLDGTFRTEHLNFDQIGIVPSLKLSKDLTSTGYFKGKYYDFYTKTEAQTPLGDVAVDMKVFIPMKKPENLTLEGEFSTKNLNLDAFGFIPNRKISDNITSKGYFKGHYYDFDLRADAVTSIGEITCDIHLKIPPFGGIQEYEYQGFIDVRNFNLDALALTPDPISKSLTFKGRVNGRGIDWKKLGIEYEGSVANTEIMGYKIEKLEGKFAVANQSIYGHGFFQDGKTKVYADTLHLNINQKHYVLKGTVENLDFKKYKIYDKEHIIASSIVNADIQGNNLDNLVGKADLSKAHLQFVTRGKDLNVNQLTVNKQNFNDSTFLKIDGSWGNAMVTGFFKFDDLQPKFTQLYDEVKLFLINDDSLLQDYYKKKIFTGNPMKLHLFYRATQEANQVFDFLDQPIYVADKSLLGVNLHIPNNAEGEDNLQLNYNADSSFYDVYSLKKPNIVVALTKDARPQQIDLGNIYLSGKVDYDHFYLLKCENPDEKVCRVFNDTASFIIDKSNLVVDWNGDIIKTEVNARQDKTGYIADFTAASRLYLDGKIISQFEKGSKFIMPLQDKIYEWEVLAGNQITSFPIKQYFIFSNLGFFEKNLNQQFLADGVLSKDATDSLNISANNIGLELINKFANVDIGYKLDGKLNAKVFLQNIFNTPKVFFEGVFKNFSLDDYKYGDIVVDGDWEGENKRVNVDAKLVDRTGTLLDLSGNYNYGKDMLAFNMSSVTQLPLSYITPFVKDQLSDLQGGLEVKSFQISGSSSNPIVLGKGILKDAGFGFNFFKTKYLCNGEINFDIDRMEIASIKPIIIEDENKNTAEFYGAIYHKGMKDFQFDLQFRKISDFLIMNLKKEDKGAFYGPVIIKSGFASISGSLKKLDIDAFGITGKGSHLYIPISDDDAMDKPDYIHFNGESVNLGSKKVDVLGINVNLNVQATEDAWVELVFDERLGDIIKGRGNGTLQMNLTPQGDFFMYGNYEIVQGDYLFTVQNFVNKKFFVKPGGKVIWNGDPFNAQLDMQAYYPIYTNVQPILNTTQPLRTNVNVVMNLQGELMKPNIGLSIEPSQTSTNASDLGTDLSAYLKTISYDQQELNKQVFFLLTTGQFVPAGSASAGNLGVNTAINSVSELLSNQLNYWLAKSVGNKVNVAVGSNTFTDVTLQISANLFNDRVTIERDGTLVGQNTNFSVGNVSIKTKLRSFLNDSLAQYNSRKGDWIFEVFYRNNQTGQLTGGNQTGAGVFYKNDFDSFGELFRRKKKKK